jgi:ribosomal protein S18 acetylase RimI-like enzyme
MAEFSIKHLTKKDSDKAKVSVALFWKTFPDTKTISHFLDNPHNILLSAEVAGESVGQLIGYILDRWDRHEPMQFLYSIDVMEKYHRQEIARALIKEFRKIGRELGCFKTFVFTNENNIPAMRLYESSGGKRLNQDDVMFEYD